MLTTWQFTAVHLGKGEEEAAHRICQNGRLLWASFNPSGVESLWEDKKNMFAFLIISRCMIIPRQHYRKRAHDAIITSLWRQNDVATSFRRHNDVIIASCVRWGAVQASEPIVIYTSRSIVILCTKCDHYNGVIMSAMASQTTGVPTVCSTVGSGADQRKHQSSASLAFV